MAGTAPWKRVRAAKGRPLRFSPFAHQGQIFEIRPGQRRGFFPPAFRRQVKIRGTNQVPDSAAFVRFFDAGPHFVQLQPSASGSSRITRFRKQPENAAVGARHRSIELPPRKNARARVAHRLLHNLRRSRNAFPRKPRVDRTEQLFGDRSFRQRQKQRLIDRVRRPLARRIKLAHRFDLIAEKLDAHRPVRFRRIHIENAAASRILPGHFHHIGRAVADRVQVLQQFLQIENLTATQNPRQVGVVLGRTKKNSGRAHRRNDNRGAARRNLPQGRGAFFLNLRMRRQILERKDIARRKADDRVGIGGAGQFAESAQHRQQLFGSAVVGHHQHKRTLTVRRNKTTISAWPPGTVQ
jgi:hypothetical protein